MGMGVSSLWRRLEREQRQGLHLSAPAERFAGVDAGGGILSPA